MAWSAFTWRVPGRIDLVLASVVLASGVLEIAAGQLHGPLAVSLASLLLFAICLLIRRTSLWAAVLVAFATVVGAFALGLSQQDYLASIVACLALLTWVGYSLDRGEAVLGFAYGFTCVAATNNPSALGNDAWLLVVMGGSWAAGRALRSRRQLIDELRSTTAELERSREELAARAVAEERLRIAREIHDVIAHSVTVMLVQAEAAERLLDRPAQARAALGAVQDTARTAVVELRQLLGVLRPEASVRNDAPQPRLDDLPTLLASYVEAGLQVESRTRASVPDLPPAVQLTVYRITQEALTNVLRHSSAGAATLDLHATRGALELEVCDGGPSRPHTAAPGHGLEGMRERVRACGGSLEAGPHGQGFRVRARIPVDAG